MVNILLKTLLKIVLLLLVIVGAVYSWGPLCALYPEAVKGHFARRADSYLPNLADLEPGLLRNGKEAVRFLGYYQLIDRASANLPGVREMLGYCYYYSGDMPKALEYYDKALLGSPDSFMARYNLGVIYYRRSKFEKAERYFQDAVAIAETNALAYIMTSKVYSQFRVVQKLTLGDMISRSRGHYADAKRYIRLCMEKQGKTKDIFLMAMRYNDLLKIWTENGGEPSTHELIIF